MNASHHAVAENASDTTLITRKTDKEGERLQSATVAPRTYGAQSSPPELPTQPKALMHYATSARDAPEILRNARPAPEAAPQESWARRRGTRELSALELSALWWGDNA